MIIKKLILFISKKIKTYLYDKKEKEKNDMEEIKRNQYIYNKAMLSKSRESWPGGPLS
jgi:hypothetical protein